MCKKTYIFALRYLIVIVPIIITRYATSFNKKSNTGYSGLREIDGAKEKERKKANTVGNTCLKQGDGKPINFDIRWGTKGVLILKN